MDQIEDAVVEETTTDEVTQPTQEKLAPVFEEVEAMNADAAINVLIQVGNMATSAGVLSVRDNVILAKAISILRPGTI